VTSTIAGHPCIEELSPQCVTHKVDLFKTAVLENNLYGGGQVVFSDIVEIEPFPLAAWRGSFRVSPVTEQVDCKPCISESPREGVVSLVVEALVIEAQTMGQENRFS